MIVTFFHWEIGLPSFMATEQTLFHSAVANAEKDLSLNPTNCGTMPMQTLPYFGSSIAARTRFSQTFYIELDVNPA